MHASLFLFFSFLSFTRTKFMLKNKRLLCNGKTEIIFYNYYFIFIYSIAYLFCLRVRGAITILVQYFRRLTARKRVNFYTTDQKFGYNSLALVTLDDTHSRLTKRGNNNNGRLVKKSFFAAAEPTISASSAL